jgi:hypothetical protein
MHNNHGTCTGVCVCVCVIGLCAVNIQCSSVSQ